MKTVSGGHGLRLDRRTFLANAATLGAASLLGLPRTAEAEPPPETTRLRVFASPIPCKAPEYVARELLRAEGFTDVRYLEYPSEVTSSPPDGVLSGVADITLSYAPKALFYIESGAPIVLLAGSHIGCIELVASHRVRSIRDLRGKTVAISSFGSAEHVFISMFVAYVGVDPSKDINWIVRPTYTDHVRLFLEGKFDAFVTSPPASVELREKNIGHVLINTTVDNPWAHYHCCFVVCAKDFVGRYPVATKRALRAYLKATDLCARDPARVARIIADQGLARYDYTLKMLEEIPYGRWRDYDPEDAVRFYALRMRELGMLKGTPKRIVAKGTNWRFLNALRTELKA
jgi:NitT/TauT family transport system substrate-binding protein